MPGRNDYLSVALDWAQANPGSAFVLMVLGLGVLSAYLREAF